MDFLGKETLVSPVSNMKKFRSIPVKEGRSKGTTGCLDSVYRPKFIASKNVEEIVNTKQNTNLTDDNEGSW
jgi:hypothetical protein